MIIMIMYLFLGWLLGLATSLWVLIFFIWLSSRLIGKKSDPPTKEEWKVM